MEWQNWWIWQKITRDPRGLAKIKKRGLKLCTLGKVVKLMKMVNRTMYPKFEQFESRGRAKTALIFPNTMYQLIRVTLFVRHSRWWPRTSCGRGIRCCVSSCGWSIQYGRRRLCHIPDTGKFLEQVSRISLWICAAHTSSEPLLSCFACRGQCLCWLQCSPYQAVTSKIYCLK